ncbi:ClpXP protease specificity-enhancing factor [Hydrogenophaga sp.]|uniref:ClpXP protease specificity-enhancing factor n=1 Tax=Hydrogenophaga sp. TaxID=1904254 RepID=UPI00286E3C5B|nr:ClpXP protease specificity-enhancing factor [Hydrogenophaga sp.]
MNTPEQEAPSTRPYLIRALHEWCADNGFSPYIAVHVDAAVQVPQEFVKNGEIVLNVSFDATSGLRLGNEFIEFKARFGGAPRDIVVPVTHVVAIYARENGQGMAFPPPPKAPSGASSAVDPVPAQPAPAATREPLRSVTVDAPDGVEPSGPETPPAGPGNGGRPQLKRVK